VIVYLAPGAMPWRTADQVIKSVESVKATFPKGIDYVVQLQPPPCSCAPLLDVVITLMEATGIGDHGGVRFCRTGGHVFADDGSGAVIGTFACSREGLSINITSRFRSGAGDRNRGGRCRLSVKEGSSGISMNGRNQPPRRRAMEGFGDGGGDRGHYGRRCSSRWRSSAVSRGKSTRVAMTIAVCVLYVQRAIAERRWRRGADAAQKKHSSILREKKRSSGQNRTFEWTTSLYQHGETLLSGARIAGDGVPLRGRPC